MASTATLTVEKENPEKEAWELFEVGSYDEVIQLAKENPDSQFLMHLGVISRMENGDSLGQYSPKGMSLLSPLVEAYVDFRNRRFDSAKNQLEIYYKNKNALVSYPFTKLSVEVFFQTKKYDYALAVIRGYKKKCMDLAFIKEEAISLYYLKRYDEVIGLYKNHSKDLNDAEVHRVIGMSLLFLGKHNDAEKILEQVPGKLKLPSFEEKRKEYVKIYQNIGTFESNRKQLSPRELEDLGFAYLFHSEYSKAEEVFTELSNLLK